jgi:phage tail sheath protein FI
MIQFIDRPINNALIDAITETVNGFIRTLIGREALVDGECTYNPSKNPPTQVANGQLVFDLTFMPPVPGERITFEAFIDINLLSNLGAE